jgi:hypothetical protein
VAKHPRNNYELSPIFVFQNINHLKDNIISSEIHKRRKYHRYQIYLNFKLSFSLGKSEGVCLQITLGHAQIGMDDCHGAWLRNAFTLNQAAAALLSKL